MKDKEKPSRWQAKVWADTVLEPIISGKWFDYSDRNVMMLTARKIGDYFPEFGHALSAWVANSSTNEEGLKLAAERVFLALPVPYDQPDIQNELDAAEEHLAQIIKAWEGLFPLGDDDVIMSKASVLLKLEGYDLFRLRDAVRQLKSEGYADISSFRVESPSGR